MNLHVFFIFPSSYLHIFLLFLNIENHFLIFSAARTLQLAANLQTHLVSNFFRGREHDMKIRVYLSSDRKGTYWATTTHPQSCYNLPVIIDKGKNVIGPRHSIETGQGNIPIGKVTVGDQDGMGNALDPENQATWKVRLKWAGYDV